METEAIDNQANLVNYDNENENEIDDLGYQSEEYIEVAHEDDENNHSNGYAKRGITRLCKFRKEYGKPGGVKLSVTFNALNRISGKHRALFSSFLGDMVREHIGLQILSWKKVGPEANLVNYDNENENEIDDLGYQSEEYIEDAHEDDENNHSNGYAKRGITRLCKFRREYGKPGGVKLSVTFDALNRISGKHRALFSSFLGDMVREHIGLQILSWKKVGPEARNKLWDEITRYFDVDLTVRKLVKSAKAKMAHSKCVFPHTIGRGGYAHAKEKNEIKQDEEPTRGTLWLKGRVNKDVEYQDDEIRSVGGKLKETEDKIKEGTLQVDQGTNSMTIVLGKEKGGYARGVGSGVTYKRYFDLPRSKQIADERILLLESQLDAARREREEKELLIKNVKLVKDLHTTNFDQLHAYLEQHELHANEVRLLRECNQDPLAFMANQQMTPPHFNTYQSPYNNPQLHSFHHLNMD
ncbi:reverse transcriptase domain-containing protein [Tanacetum coccineum]